MSKRSVKDGFLWLLLATYILAYRFYIFDHYMKYSEIISASFMVFLLAFSISLLGYRKDKQTNLGKSVFKVVLFYLCLAFFIMFGFGMLVGFLKNAYSLSFFTLLDNIIAPIIIIVTVEFLRYVIVWANRDKKIFIWFYVILFMIFELFMSTKTFPIHDFEAMFRLGATLILPIIVKHVLLTYLCYHVGWRSPLLYRSVMDVYVYIVPILPNLGEYVHSMILVSLPFMIYLNCYAMIDDRVQRQQPIFYKKSFSVYDIPVAAVIIAMVCLISGAFPHFMIGIGSDSMSPKIKKGDAVIIQKIDKKAPIKEGEIVAYMKSGRIVVHRAVEVKKNSIITKGDANTGNDPKPIPRNQVKGIVKFKIPFIAYPTVLLNDFIR